MNGTRARRILAAVTWAASITLTMQVWVGGATIYRAELRPQIDAAHNAILHNQAPGGSTWTEYGLNSTNIRVGVVFLAEGVRRITGLQPPLAYRVLDTVALFATLLLLLAFLGRLAPPSYALIGAMLFATALPLTYQFFYFHPWDRLSVLGWIVLLTLLERGRFGLFAATLPVAMLVKFDVVLMPALYFLVTVPLRGDRRALVRSAVVTMLMFAITFGVYWALQGWRPGGFEPVALKPLAVYNITTLRELKLSYPPLLGLGVPIMLAAVGIRRAERFAQACVVFAALLLVVFVLKARFEEFRALVPVFILLLPAALLGLRTLVESYGVPRTEAPLAKA